MACVLTTGFAQSCRRSKGGIQKVYITELANEATFTVASGVVTAFTLASGKQFFTYELPQGSSSATATVAGERAVGSRFYTHSVQIQVPKFETALRNELLLLAQNTVMIIVLDENGKYFLYGHSEASARGLEISEGTAQTGTASADLNGINITFTGDELDLPLEVTSSLIADLTQPA